MDSDDQEKDYGSTAEIDHDIQTFVSRNPYPSFNAMRELLKSHRLAMSILAEYGKLNHELMKSVYNNITDRTFCAKVAQKIDERGGFQALQMNYYALSCSPLRDSKNKEIQYCYTRLQHYWDGVGEWRA